MAEGIYAKVSESFDKAVDEGDVFFYPSTLHTHKEGVSEVLFGIDLSYTILNIHSHSLR